MLNGQKMQILVGMIASGKSTFASLWAEQGAIIVNDDAIVQLVHGGTYTLYEKSLKCLYKSIETHVATMAIAMGKTVLIDRGVNVTVDGRRRWIGLAHALDVPCEAVIFKIVDPSEHAIRRFRNDGRGKSLQYWRDVAKEHAASYAEPTFAEGFDSIISLDNNLNEHSVQTK